MHGTRRLSCTLPYLFTECLPNLPTYSLLPRLVLRHSQKQTLLLFDRRQRMNTASNSMQRRLLRILPNVVESTVSKPDDDLAFWEKELIESRQPNRPAAPPETDDNHEDSTILVKQSHSSQEPADLIPGTTSDQIVYLSKGRRSGGTYPIELDDQNDSYDSDVEPVSSSNELVGQFCIFSQVVKFPYKYMQDPENRVSRRFFANEKIFERSWDM